MLTNLLVPYSFRWSPLWFNVFKFVFWLSMKPNFSTKHFLFKKLIYFFPSFIEIAISDSQSWNGNFGFFILYSWSQIDNVGSNFLWSITTLQTIGLSTIKRHLKKLNLFRRPVEGIRTDDATFLAAVKEELSGGGSNIGYRRAWAHLRKTGLKVRREDVRRAILQYDPDGVSKRKRRKLRRRKYFSAGPNYLLAYWWPWQAETVLFFVAWMYRWLFEETNMAWSIILWQKTGNYWQILLRCC